VHRRRVRGVREANYTVHNSLTHMSERLPRPAKEPLVMDMIWFFFRFLDAEPCI
jgi:hypothetical protein